VSFAVDDAGAGYASLRHVISLQPDITKLDIGLVRGLDTNPLLSSVTRAPTTLGSEIGARVVAEGVETESEAAALKDIGARFAQGFLFARPMPVADLFGSGRYRVAPSQTWGKPALRSRLRSRLPEGREGRRLPR
jgi:EAL domain-containing protein (putative c-di-GMP-specific phosphodiesterase class I)